MNKTLEKHRKQFPVDWNHKPIESNSLPKVIHQTHSDLFEDMHFEVARVQLRHIEQALVNFEGERSQKDLAAQALKVHSAGNLKKSLY